MAEVDFLLDENVPPEGIPHAGILLYARASLINNRTGDVLDAIERILSSYSRSDLRNRIVWITDWL